jgi:hypothetical protein
LVVSNQPQDPAGFAFITTDGLPDLQLNEIDHHHPSRPENMDMSRRMIVWINHDPQAVDAQDRGHDLSYQNLSGQETPWIVERPSDTGSGQKVVTSTAIPNCRS